jgi:iron complex transport system permease protein
LEISNFLSTFAPLNYNAMPTSVSRIYFCLSFLLLLLLIADVAVGSTTVAPLEALKAWLCGEDSPQSIILFRYRIPKTITAIMAGVSLSISGLQMQTVFRNPLADPYILGVSTGAGLGVALFLLGAPFFSTFALFSLGQAFAAWVGAAGIMLLLVAVSARVRDIMAILVLGVILGSAVSAIITLLQYFGQAAALKSYVLWTMGSIGNVSASQLVILCATTLTGSIAALFSCKALNALMLGEDYARTLGYRVGLQRTVFILIATLLTGAVTAFCGPIGFVGIAVPHVARMLCRSANHGVLMPVSMLLGACALLLCDVLSQLPAGYDTSLPINTITALLGLPVVIFVIVRNQKTI